MIASLVYHGQGRAVIKTPFDRAFVDRLKECVPADYRSWDPQTKIWTVENPYIDLAAQVLVRFFPDAHVEDKPYTRPHFDFGSQRGHTCGCNDDHRALFVCVNAPPEIIRAAYRTLAKMNHPDRGGDSSTMQQLNGAFERLTAGSRS